MREPLRDGLAANRRGSVAERIVDALEMVEIEADCRPSAAAPPAAADAHQRISQSLVEQHPVGQASQRVVMRHMGDARLSLLPAAVTFDELDQYRPPRPAKATRRRRSALRSRCPSRLEDAARCDRAR